MKVRCIDNKNGGLFLTIGKEYEVESELNYESDDLQDVYCVENDKGETAGYLKIRFEIVEDEKPVEILPIVEEKKPLMVRCIDASARVDLHTDRFKGQLTEDKIYEVTEETDGFYLLSNDNGVVARYYKERFEIVEDEKTAPEEKFSVKDDALYEEMISAVYNPKSADSERSWEKVLKLGERYGTDNVPLADIADELLNEEIRKTSGGQASRFNTGKPKWGLVDFESLEPMVRVLEFGAKKYVEHNWKKGLPTTEICESLLRHVFAYLRGEDKDPESGISHIGHIQCNAMFLSHMMNFKPEFDNREKDNSNEKL